jgi:hypothetical protein
MNWLQKAGAAVGGSMIAGPIALETSPIAVFQNVGDLLLCYLIGAGILGLVGWSLPDDDNHTRD